MSIVSTPTDREAADWRRMPFLDRDGGWNPCHAKGPARGGEEQGLMTAANWAIGSLYAATLIDHIRTHRTKGGQRLAETVAAIMAAGAFGPVERSFFHALGGCLECGEVPAISAATVAARNT